MKANKLLIVTILAFTMLSLSACETQPKPTSEKSTVAPDQAITRVDFGFKTKSDIKDSIEDHLVMARPGEGLGLALHDMRGDSFSNNIIYADGKADFFISLYSYVPKEVAYKLINLIDFTQEPIAIDKQQYKDGYDFTMPSNSVVDFPISVSCTQPGLHEVLFVLVISSKNKSLDEEYRYETNLNHLLFYRLFIIVKGDKTPAQSISYDHLSTSTNTKFAGILLNRDSNVLTSWIKDQCKPGEEIQSYIHVGSAHKDSRTQYAVILLNEWKQTVIDDGKKTVFLEMEPDSQADIPALIKMPDADGVYNITPIIIESPYDLTCEIPVRTSFRTGIEVSSHP